MDIFGSLDVLTLFRLMFLADLVVCLLLLGYDGGRHRRELRGFVAARSLHGAACLVIGFGTNLPTFWSIVVPTWMVMFGLALESVTIAALRGSRLVAAALPLGAAAAGSFGLAAVSSVAPWMVGVASAVLGFLSACICFALIGPADRSRLVWAMFAVFGANAAAQFVRAYGGFFNGVVIGDQTWQQLTGLLTSYVYCVGGGVGFLLLLKEDYDRQLRRDASTDSLTGLLNHRAFFTAARERLDTVEPEGSLCLLSIDLDHFKLVNDTYGHPAGDEVLRKVGATLADHCGADCTVGRVGGEEFAVFQPGGAEAALALAECLRRAMAAIRLAEFPEYRCTASIGLAQARGARRESIHALVRRCDHALYEAKSAGRNRVVVAADEALGQPVGRASAAA